MAKQWKQVGGDVNPKEYGAVLARVTTGHWDSVEVVRIDTDDESDLAWDGPAKGSKIASSIGASKAEWNAMSLVEKGAAAIGYHGSGWSDESGGRRVEKWSDALPARSNQIAWWR